VVFLGIDPGQSGGIARIQDGKAQAWAMPGTERDILDLLRELSVQPCRAILEKVGPMPKQGVVSVWGFSGSYHGLRMALHACDIPFEMVPPGVWQRGLGCLTKGDKNITKRRAQELYPYLKITHTIADALLLATFCQRAHYQ